MSVDPTSRNRKVREQALRLAILRICAGRPVRISRDRKLSIAAVAEEAQVSSALIHNRYPHIAVEIRARRAPSAAIPPKGRPLANDERPSTPAALKDLARLASINASLLMMLEEKDREVRVLMEVNSELSRKCSDYVRQLNKRQPAILRIPSRPQNPTEPELE